MRRGTLVVALLVVLSGCTLPGTSGQFDTERDLGYVGDYAHDDEFAFDHGNALTEAELEAVTYRAMARLEVLRGQKFRHDVDLEVIPREEYRDRRGEREAASTFVNEVWRAAFVVDGETDVNREREVLYGDAVQGYYANDRIVIVVDDADGIRIGRRTLVHELTHALQDQHVGLARDGDTIDERRGEQGLIEGEANYLPGLYDERCDETWQCLPDREPSGELEPRERPFNVGLFLSIYAPYAEGPSFVAHHRERGGWDAIDRAHGNRPRSTAQVIHPERYPDDAPVAVDVPDRSSDGWAAIVDDEGHPRTETIGEATLFATLWANGVIDRPLREGAATHSRYNYSHPATAGWAGDAVRAYEGPDGETGYVWILAWDGPADARAFADAHRRLLERNGAQRVDDGAGIGADDTSRADAADASVRGDGAGTYRIDDGDPFAGAYRVTVDDATVTIVGGPTVDALAGLHAMDAAAVSAGAAREIPEPATSAPSSTAQPTATNSAAADG